MKKLLTLSLILFIQPLVNAKTNKSMQGIAQVEPHIMQDAAHKSATHLEQSEIQQSNIVASGLQIQDTPLNNKKLSKRTAKKNNKETFVFQYENEDLVNIINRIAAEKNINIVLPQGPNAINAKITLHIDKKLNLDKAWNLLLTILDVAGFSVVPKDNIYNVVPTTPLVGQEPMPVFIGTPIDSLPDSDQRIRFVHYLANIKVSKEPTGELAVIFQQLMPAGTVFLTDTASNAMIIVGKSQDIKAIMTIVTELDQAGFHEKMEPVKLNHTNAQFVADLFAKQILRPEESPINRYRLDTRKPADTYFSSFTRVIPDMRTNTIFLLGRTQAVERLKDFIEKYIDVTIDSGKSILHTKQLQYLEATQVADVLQRIVESRKIGSTGQAQGATETGGVERFFDQVIIKADTPEKIGDKEALGYQYYGGNKLVIAARNDDWKIIERFIEEIDTPQPQVLIEVLIADLTMDDQRELGQQFRNPDKIPNPSDVNIQSAQLTAPILNSDTDPTTIAADLLRDSNRFSIDGVNHSYASAVPKGATLISFNDNDGKTWSLLQVLKSFGHTKIISHPHVMSTNNKEATIRIGESRLVTDEAELGNTAANIKNKYINADLLVKIVPRISADNMVNLSIDIKIQEFIGTTNNTKINRNVLTNANVKDKSILALGGLIRTRDSDGVRETPVLSKVPILGWFFKDRTGRAEKNNLTVFISPTIIQPRLRSGVSDYTRDYIQLAKEYSMEGELFDSLRDPITRWFFKTGASDAAEKIEQFLEKDEFQNGTSQENTFKSRRNMRKSERIAARKEAKKTKQLKALVAAHDDNPLLKKQQLHAPAA